LSSFSVNEPVLFVSVVVVVGPARQYGSGGVPPVAVTITFPTGVPNAETTVPLITGRGAKGWFGWWDNADAQALTAQWLSAPDSVGQEKAAKALSHVAMTDVATVPVGQWYGKTAFRRSITGVLQGVSPYPWNVRPV